MCLSYWSKHKQISFFNIRLFDGTEIQGQVMPLQSCMFS